MTTKYSIEMNEKRKLAYSRKTQHKNMDNCKGYYWQKQFTTWRRRSEYTFVCVFIVLFTVLHQTRGHTNMKKIQLDLTTELTAIKVTDRKPKKLLNDNVNSLNDNYSNDFRPMLPSHLQAEYMSANVFTKDGNYRVFHPDDSDLRFVALQKTTHDFNEIEQNAQNFLSWQPKLNNYSATNKNIQQSDDISELESLLEHYMNEFFGNKSLPFANATRFQLQQLTSPKSIQRIARNANEDMTKLEHQIPRSDSSGRLLFSAGLKKVMWPIYMGLQILKSLLFAMFLPTLIGSVGQLLGKGIISGSAPLFIRPMDPPQDLDFNFDDDKKFTTNDESNKDNNNIDNYGYPTPEASQVNNQYAYHPNSVQPNRYGQDTYLSALQSLTSASFKNSNSISTGSLGGMMSPSSRNKPIAAANVNTFQTFQKVPASSLLLSNYDPFYSPLLSRLDSVFAQLKLNSQNEVCREKAICLMYANPAKYAPYSNLVSAQLSRELNELRKPTSDNPDILRFFKYMRAAKDGQDGVDCEKTFDDCKEFKDYENPAMVSTYHDINKLVQARKFPSE